MPLQLAQKLLHLTFSCLTQIILRGDQGTSVNPWLPQRSFVASSSQGTTQQTPYLLEQC